MNKKSCEETVMVPSLDGVSSSCKGVPFCKSKVQGNGSFKVELYSNHDGCADPRAIHVVEGVTPEDKTRALDALLDRSGFDAVITEACKDKGPSCKIYIKANFSPSTQKEHKSYTDPELVEHVARRLGNRDVTIFETETRLVDLSLAFNPEVLAGRLDPPYTMIVENLTPRPRQSVSWKEGTLEVSKDLVDADAIINMGKMKSLSEYHVSMALKNMYGALPERDKYRQFHWKLSGMDVEDATLVSNHSTPADFIIMDGIVTQDGNESSVHLSLSQDQIRAGIIAAGRDPLVMDKYFTVRMGMDQDKSSITRREADFRGNVDVKLLGPIIDVTRYTGGGKLEPVETGKFSLMKDMTSGRKWNPPSDLVHHVQTFVQFTLPSMLGLSTEVMKAGMCLVSKNTVLTDEEKKQACPGTGMR